jgi:hypothetical protein
MRNSDDRDYFIKRARQEEEDLAARSPDQTATVHASMAPAYRRRIFGAEQKPYNEALPT